MLKVLYIWFEIDQTLPNSLICFMGNNVSCKCNNISSLSCGSWLISLYEYLVFKEANLIL